MVIYLVGFVLLLLFVSRYYLIPALQAAGAVKTESHIGAGPAGSDTAAKAQLKTLAAHATLVLAVVLFILLSGLLLTFRIGRFFRPREISRPKPTTYVDAWEESAKRLRVPPEENAAEDEGDVLE